MLFSEEVSLYVVVIMAYVHGKTQAPKLRTPPSCPIQVAGFVSAASENEKPEDLIRLFFSNIIFHLRVHSYQYCGYSSYLLKFCTVYCIFVECTMLNITV